MAHGETLVALTAVDCVLFTLFAFGSVTLASTGSADVGYFAVLVRWIGSVATWLFLVIIPFLVIQVTYIGFLVVLAVEIILVATYYIGIIKGDAGGDNSN